MRFELNYQANLTAWGAAACMRLWRITDDEYYLQQGYVYLASFFHNCVIWESEIAHAANYKVFLGATCLHDAPYMAIFECFDSFAAFEQYLKDSGPGPRSGGPAAGQRILQICARPRLVLLSRRAAGGGAGQGRYPQRPYRPGALVPDRGSVCRWPACGPGRAGDLRRGRGVRLCDPLVPQCQRRAIPYFL